MARPLARVVDPQLPHSPLQREEPAKSTQGQLTAENAELRRQLEELKLAFTAQGGKFEDEKAADRLATLRLQRGYVGGVGFRPV